jgi:putative tryptophan/tyrosine transport system substrate-binding protein
MGTRTATAAICLTLLTCAAAAQTPTKSARMGILCPVRCVGIGYTAFNDELQKLGWDEGRNLIIERKEAEGRYERLPELAAELVRSKPDLIVAATSPPARAAMDATSHIPIVFSFVSHPVEIGLVSSLARPGGNVTGVAAGTPGTLLAKHFQILRELLPKAQRFAILINPANASSRMAVLHEVPMAAQLGLQIDVINVRGPEEIRAAVAEATRLGADGLVIVGDPMLNTPPNRVPDLAAEAALPAIYENRVPVEAGGLISHAPSLVAIARRHAQYVDRILRGASPSDLPVEQPTKYDFTINLKAAKALGLTVPPSLLSNADELIE